MDKDIVFGFVAPGFEEVKNVFRDNFIVFGDVGAACSVYVGGRKVVDLWGGYQNKKEGIKWNQKTVCNVYSVTKAISNTCIALLVDQGRLSYHDLISTHWPEFSQNGKEKFSVFQLLTHRAGLSYFDDGPVSMDIIPKIFREISSENEAMRKRFSDFLAIQTPKWEIQPNVSGYHVFTVGFFVSEIVQHVDPQKRCISTFFQEEIANKLDAQFFMGIPENFDEDRLSRHYTGKVNSTPKEERVRAFMEKSSTGWKSHNAINKFSVWKARRLEIPSAIGFGSASSIASVLSIIANDGTVEGISFMKPSTVQMVFKRTGKSKDLVYGEEIEWTQGGFHGHPKNPHVIWHGGFGGSLVYVDNLYKMSFAFVTNTSKLETEDDKQFFQAPRQSALLNVVYNCLKKSKL